MQKSYMLEKIVGLLTRLDERKLRIAYQFLVHLDR